MSSRSSPCFLFPLKRMDFAISTNPSLPHESKATPTSHQETQRPLKWRSSNTGRWPSVLMLHIAPLFSTAAASTMNLLVVSCVRASSFYISPSLSATQHTRLVFSRQHPWWPGPRCACSGIRHPGWGTILVDKELMVHLLGQWWLHPHVNEG